MVKPGDMVQSVVPSDEKACTHIGKVAVGLLGVLTCRPRLASCRVSIANTVLC